MKTLSQICLSSSAKLIIILIGVTLSLLSCSESSRKQTAQLLEKNSLHDTVVVSKVITDEIAGSAHRIRANGYSIVVNQDTSNFMVIFSEGRGDSLVSIRAFYDSNIKEGKAYKDRLKEFQKVLEVANEHYNFDSLHSISIGRLITTGDLAVAVSNEYIKEFGHNFEISSNSDISNFLLNSRLANDFNMLFKPYSIKVKWIEVEKVFFSTKESLVGYYVVETDTANIPENILDCIAWIVLERKQGV